MPPGRVHLRAFLATLVACGVAACVAEEPVSAEDKAIFLRAADFAKFGFRYENAEAHEKFSRLRNFDGTHQLTYQFSAPQSETDRPLYIYASVSVERRVSDAMIAQKAEKLGLLIGFKSEGAEERELPERFPTATTPACR